MQTELTTSCTSYDEELRSLILKYRETKEKKYSDEFVLKCMPIVYGVTQSLSSLLSYSVEVSDLVQTGAIALIKLLQDFDLDKPDKLTTLINRRVRWDIMAEYRWKNGDSNMDRSFLPFYKKIGRTRTILIAEKGYVPTEKEILEVVQTKKRKAKWLQKKAKEVVHFQRYSCACPEGKEEDGGHEPMIYKIHDQQDQDKIINTWSEHEILEARMEKHLSEEERNLLSNYFFNGMTQAVLAKSLLCSPGTISLKIAKAVKKLREGWTKQPNLKLG